MKLYKSLFCIILFLASISINNYAVPAYPHLITKTQPNGEEITLRMKGNENLHWMESEDGYSLLYRQDKYIVFATKDEKGNMIPSNVIAQKKANRSIEVQNLLKRTPKNIQFSQQQKETLLQINELTLRSSNNSSQAMVGKVNVICALMEFPDKPFSHTVEEFEQLMNQMGYSNGAQRGSVRDYFLESSYGQLDVSITVVGICKAKNDHTYYGQSDVRYAVELAKEAADFAFSVVNPSNYDKDGDGYIDAFHMIFAGYGEETGGGEDCIWSHQATFYPASVYGNKRMNTYSCSPELRGNPGDNPQKGMTYIGVICHELGHILGAPDYYDTDYEGSGGYFPGTGSWDLMADGSWNNSGATPAHFNMFQKIHFGWVKATELNVSQRIAEMPNSTENPVAYLIKSTNSSEYYILENRQQLGFDTAVPGSGLLIYHINYQPEKFDQNRVNAGHPQGVYTVAANSKYKVPTENPDSYGVINAAGSLFGINSWMSNREFSDDTTPSANLFSGEKLGKSLTDIRQNTRLMSFNFNVETTNLNLTATIERDRVTLRWDAPETDKTIKGYNIYKNNAFILFSTQNSFRETVRAEGEYIYGVSVLFDDYESEIEKVIVNMNWTNIESIDLIDEDIPVELLFYTLFGQLIRKETGYIQQIQQQINLPAGIYILQIRQGQAVSTSKFTVR
jgi:M6 family metalloprotease-like protein